MRNVGVLGNGVTAKAVKEYIARSKFHQEVHINHADLIITSPGIPPLGWPKTSVEIISDIEFVFRIFKEKNIKPTIIGITGTNGKTTVVSALAHVFNTSAYGNIGVPLIKDVDKFNNESILIIELSSFQLKSSPLLICDIAVITNISKDHIDWHQSFEHYEQAKLSIIKSQNQVVIIPKRYKQKLSVIPNQCYLIESLSGNKQWFNEKHNQKNMEVVEKVALQLGLTIEKINEKLKSFELPPFRCQRIYKDKNVTIINDSKSTNMHSTLAAINSYQTIDVLILSGQAKGPLSEDWALEVKSKCQRVLL